MHGFFYFKFIRKGKNKMFNNNNNYNSRNVPSYRVKSYYSDPLEFEKLYKNKVDDYILRKYPQYYNGK